MDLRLVCSSDDDVEDEFSIEVLGDEMDIYGEGDMGFWTRYELCRPNEALCGIQGTILSSKNNFLFSNV